MRLGYDRQRNELSSLPLELNITSIFTSLVSQPHRSYKSLGNKGASYNGQSKAKASRYRGDSLATMVLLLRERLRRSKDPYQPPESQTLQV